MLAVIGPPLPKGVELRPMAPGVVEPAPARPGDKPGGPPPPQVGAGPPPPLWGLGAMADETAAPPALAIRPGRTANINLLRNSHMS